MTRLPNTPYRYCGQIDHGPRTGGTVGVVIHDIEGSASSAENYFRSGSSGVGAHIIVGKSSVVQLVPLESKCWHAVDANANRIGLEHEGFASDSRKTWIGRRKQRVLSANRVAWICYHYQLGVPKWGGNVRSHASGGVAWGGHGDPGPNFPTDLYMAACVRAYDNLVRSKGRRWGRVFKGRN